MNDKSFYRDGLEIRHNYGKLVNAYNTMKLKMSDRIRVLEMELKKSRGLVEIINNRSYVELEALRQELFELEEKMKNNQLQYEERMNQILSTCTCTRESVSNEQYNSELSDESSSDINADVFDENSRISMTCESCIFNKAQLDELNNQTCDLLEEIKKRTEALHGSERLNQVFTKEIEEKDRVLEIFAEELKHTLVEYSRSSTKLKAANEKIMSMETAITDLHDINCERNQEIRDHIKTEQELKDELLRQNEKLEECEKSKKMCDQICADLANRIDEIQNTLDTRNQENTLLQKIVETLNKTYKNAEEKVNDLQARLETCTEDLSLTVLSLESSNEENKSLKCELESISNKFKNSEKSLTDMELQLNGLIDDNAHWKSMYERVSNQIISNEKLLIDKDLSLNDSMKENLVIKSMIKTMCEKLDTYEIDKRTMEAKLNDVSCQNDNLKSKIGTLSNENERLVGMQKSLCSRIADLEINGEHKSQADMSRSVASRSKTAIQLRTPRVSSNDCSESSTGSSHKTATLPPCTCVSTNSCCSCSSAGSGRKALPPCTCASSDSNCSCSSGGSGRETTAALPPCTCASSNSCCSCSSAGSGRKALPPCTCASSDSNCSCSSAVGPRRPAGPAGPHGKPTATGACRPDAAPVSSDWDRANAVGPSDLSNRDECTAEVEKLKCQQQQRSEHIETIRQMSENGENGFQKERCDDLARMLTNHLDLRERLAADRKRAAVSQTSEKMITDNTKSHTTVGELPQTQAKPSNSQPTIATNSKPTLSTITSKTDEQYDRKSDKSSGDKITDCKSKLIKQLAKQLEEGVRKNREMNSENSFNKHYKLRKRHR